MNDFDIDLYELQTLQRRRNGMLFRFFETSYLNKLPVSRICGLTKELLRNPVRNEICALPSCIFEIESVSLMILTKCIDGKTIPCPLCQRKIYINDFSVDLDLAFSIQKFCDLPQEVQIFVDKSGQFWPGDSADSIEYANTINSIKPMNPCTPEQLDLDYMTNSINNIDATLDIASCNLVRFSNIFNCSKIASDKSFQNNLSEIVNNGIKVEKISKSQRQKIFTFWISNKTQYPLYLYYPAFDKWYAAELINLDGTTFRVYDRAVSIMAKNGKIYLIGGIVGPKSMSKEIFEIQMHLDEDITIQTFKVIQKESMPDERIFYSYCQLENNIYLLMGLYTDWNDLKDLPRNSCVFFNINTNNWNYINSARYPRAFGSAYATTNKKIYLFGGLEMNPIRKDMINVLKIEEYDIITNTWKEANTMTDLTLKNEKIILKQMCGMFCANDKNLIIFGGNFINKTRIINDNETLSTIDYNIGTKSVISGELLPNNTRINHLLSFPYNYSIFNNRIYIYTLNSDEVNKNTFHHLCLIYDLSKKSWDQKINKDQKQIDEMNSATAIKSRRTSVRIYSKIN